MSGNTVRPFTSGRDCQREVDLALGYPGIGINLVMDAVEQGIDGKALARQRASIQSDPQLCRRGGDACDSGENRVGPGRVGQQRADDGDEQCLDPDCRQANAVEITATGCLARGEQTLADIIAVGSASSSVTETWSHRLALAIDDLAGERATGRAGLAGTMTVMICRELVLHGLEQRAVDNRLVLAGMGLAAEGASPFPRQLKERSP